MTFKHSEIHYEADADALSGLSLEQREKFEDWMKRLDVEHERLGSPYGTHLMATITGLECWISWFLDGDEPEDALAEDLDSSLC